MAGANLTRDTPPPAHRQPFLGAAFCNGISRFRVWAPQTRRVDIELDPAEGAAGLTMTAAPDGYFIAESCDLLPDRLYKYRIDGNAPLPDPCSRFQPHGPHGASQLIDIESFQWTDQSWRGRPLAGQVIYELHIGTFTAAGTLDAAIERLTYLRDLGITIIELLPLATCPGKFNWGYDGVSLYAPAQYYGDHNALKRFVDRAHASGIAVILDVVYNHLGPDGNYLKCFSPHYFSSKYRTEWGEALNFDGPLCVGARDFVINNAKYWLRELHLDGFRLDATQSMFDDSDVHIVAQLVSECRAHVAREVIFIAENEPQRGEQLLSPALGGFGLDGMWNDDFHHAMRVALTGSSDGYFRDYAGKPQELLSAVKHGFLYQGQFYQWQQKMRGSPLRHIPRFSCVHFLQNHDQVANTGVGERLHKLISTRRCRAATALLLLGPQTPLLFMGQEFCASNPFMFFADHAPDLRRIVHRGRLKFIGQFATYATDAMQALIRDPGDERTFHDSKLNWDDVTTHAPMLLLHKELLRIRREDPVISTHAGADIDGAVLSDSAFVLRWFAKNSEDRLLIINLGVEVFLEPAPEPLLAAPMDRSWQLMWSSEEPRLGGCGAVSPVSSDARWRLLPECAVLLSAPRKG